MDQIEYADFAKVDFRIGQIIDAEKVDGSEKLVKLLVDFGSFGKKRVFSGIFKWYKPEDLLDKKTVFVVNIKPRNIMGEPSEAMIFGAEDESGENMSILLLDKELENGAKVF